MEQTKINDKVIFKLAKVLYDAKIKDCYMGDKIIFEQSKFPADLTPRNYTVNQPWIDIALAQARAAIKFFEQTLLPQNIEQTLLPQNIEQTLLPQNIEPTLLPQNIEQTLLPQNIEQTDCLSKQSVCSILVDSLVSK